MHRNSGRPEQRESGLAWLIARAPFTVTAHESQSFDTNWSQPKRIDIVAASASGICQLPLVTTARVLTGWRVDGVLFDAGKKDFAQANKINMVAAAVEIAGGPTAVARLCGVRRQSIHLWIKEWKVERIGRRAGTSALLRSPISRGW
jgi:hypothetical protein